MNQAQLATGLLGLARNHKYDEDTKRLDAEVRKRIRTSTTLLGPKPWIDYAQGAWEALRAIETETYELTANVAVAVGALQLGLQALHR